MIKQLREKFDLSQERLADLVGTSQPQIKRLESGERKLTKEWAERIAPHLRTSAEVILFGDPPQNDPSRSPKVTTSNDISEKPNAVVGLPVLDSGRLIPVYGQAVGGIDGEFIMNGNILYEVMAPPIISHLSKAYAVSVSGDSMAPRYEDGEICFVDPKRRVRKGDYVIAQVRLTENGPLLAYVKRFCRHNAEELVLEQFNPPKELRFPSKSVATVHYIALAGNA